MSFIFKITTTTSPQTFVIPCVAGGTFNATVDYGDGTGSQTVTAYNDANLTHSFATAGQHTITIDGTFPNVRFNNNASSRDLVNEVVDLGDVGWTDLYQAFRSCPNLTTFNSGTADTSNVTSMSYMFLDSPSLTTLDLSNFDTSSVTNMSLMFYNCSSLTTLDLSNFNTSSVTTFHEMLRGCSSLTTLDVSNFNTSSVTTMHQMFYLCSSLTALDLSSFDTSSVTRMSLMFNSCSSLTTLDVSNFNTSNVTTMADMFRDCSSLTNLDVSSFDTSSVTAMTYMFRNCSSLTTLDISNFDTSSVINMHQMFIGCTSLTALNLSSFDTSSVTDMSSMFYNCSSLTALNVSSFDTSSVTNISQMFRGCTSLTSLDVSNFNTSSVTNMSVMFFNCSSLTTLDLSNFDTSSVTNMSLMFYICSSLTTLNVSNFNTSSVTNMSLMFYNCSSLTTLDVSNFNTSSVTNMNTMFRSCSSLTTLDLSSFDTSSVINMQEMFRSCSGLTSLDVSSFNTSSTTNMRLTFLSCTSLTTLDLSNFNTSSVTNVYSMFTNCTNLTNLDIKHFNISNITDGRFFLNNANNALTTTQYDELLEAWAVQDVQPNVTWHFGDAQYTVETVADWYSPRSASSLSIIDNKLVSIADSTATFGAAQQVDNLIIGNTYKIVGTATCSNSSASLYFRVSTNSALTANILTISAIGTVKADAIFIATATTHYVGIISAGHAANDTVTLDAGITVKKITNYTQANSASEFEYSQENVFGSNVITNGGFDTDSDWLFTVPESFSIVNGVCEINHASSPWGRLRQDNIPIGSYLITFDLVIESGALTGISGSDLPNLNLTSSGSYSFVCNTTSIYIHFVFAVNPTVGSIDNISFKPITNAVIYKNIPQSARNPYTLEGLNWTGIELANPMSDYSLDNTIFTTDSSGISVDFTGGSAVGTWLISSPLEIYTDYKVSVNVSDHTRGGLSARLRTGSTVFLLPEGLGVNSAIIKSGGGGSTTIRTRTNSPVELTYNSVSVKEVIEVTEQAAFSPVTSLMSLTAAWTTRGTGYSTLSNTTASSVRVDAKISNTDDGILMEAGASTLGLILYVYNGVLYFQCGDGTAYGTANNRAEVSYTLPVGESDYIIECSADTSNAVLYVNGLVVGSQTFSEAFVGGTNDGTVGQVEFAAAVNRGGWIVDGSGLYTNTITKCDIFNNQVTADV